MSRFGVRKALSMLDDFDSEISEEEFSDQEEQFVATKLEYSNMDNVRSDNDRYVENENVHDNTEKEHIQMQEHCEHELINEHDNTKCCSNEKQASEHQQNSVRWSKESVESDMIEIVIYEAENLTTSMIQELQSDGCIVMDADSIPRENSPVNYQKVCDTIPGDIQNNDDIVDHSLEEPLDLRMNRQENEQPTGSSRKSRSKVRVESQWGKNIRKRKRQTGIEYTSVTGKRMANRKIANVVCNCKLNCTWNFTNDEVKQINSQFWSLDDDQKHGFYAETTTRTKKACQRDKKKTSSRRNFTYSYFFRKGDIKLRVCQTFYFKVLNIHDSRVKTYYKKLDRADGTQFKDMRGRKTKKKISEVSEKYVIEHINSYNRVPSHYCRATSSKEYLESHLNVQIMYEMYAEKCREDEMTPVKLSMYRNIFKTKFNIDFHFPRKDRCDTCEEMKMNKDMIDENNNLNQIYEAHMLQKNETKTERDIDRDKTKSGEYDGVAVICFDLENVISLPRADVKNFFYRRKLNVYNLTAHSSIDSGIYNAIWTEAEAGRGGNEIGSALICILREIKTHHPNVTEYVLWSDACVPQNRNSLMTLALKTFMKEHNVKRITQKFGCPGHSSIQEVDSAHSAIERLLNKREVYSPVSLVRALKSIRRTKPFHIIQLRRRSFLNLQKVTNSLRFGSIPYTKVKVLKYEEGKDTKVEYKLSFADKNFSIGIVGKPVTRKSSKTELLQLPLPEPLSVLSKPEIPACKKTALASMLPYMSAIDRQYYKAMKLVDGGDNQQKSPAKRLRID